MTDDVILECADGIAVITLNRPNALNALSTCWTSLQPIGRCDPLL